jgi:diaminopimelate epimerase
MSGSGNDFIIIDNRAGQWNHLQSDFVKAACARTTGIGADGLIFIEPSRTSDFVWRFYNSDGSQAEMCGNGGRCAARVAFLRGIAGQDLQFETIAGVVRAQVRGSRVKIQLPPPANLALNRPIPIDGASLLVHSITVGVPHVVHFVKDIEAVSVKALGAKLRFHDMFKPAGTNANFVVMTAKNTLKVRTYERGVEDETLACGTGSVASALVACAIGKAVSPVSVQTRGGEILKVYTEQSKPPFKNVYLEGETRVICNGELWDEVYPAQAQR